MYIPHVVTGRSQVWVGTGSGIMPVVIDQVVTCVCMVSRPNWMRGLSSPGFCSEMSWPCWWCDWMKNNSYGMTLNPLSHNTYSTTNMNMALSKKWNYSNPQATLLCSFHMNRFSFNHTINTANSSQNRIKVNSTLSSNWALIPYRRTLLLDQ